jgi:hypothetical protein
VVVRVLPDKRNGPGAGRPESVEQDEALAGGKSIAILALPLYRSVEFDALDPDDPRRWQSTVRAADAWWREGQPDQIAIRLRDEIEFNDRFAAWRIRMLSNDLSAALDWTAESRLPSWAELQRLRQYGTEAAA